jgi:hypothetical protein
MFAGNMNVVMLWVYIPICVNMASRRTLEAWREAVNYGIAGSGTVLFVWLCYQQLKQVLV